MEFAIRGGDEPGCTMQFFSAIPNNKQLQEVARLQMSPRHACAVVDVICRLLDYYPDKKKLSEKDGKERSKKRTSK